MYADIKQTPDTPYHFDRHQAYTHAVRQMFSRQKTDVANTHVGILY